MKPMNRREIHVRRRRLLDGTTSLPPEGESPVPSPVNFTVVGGTPATGLESAYFVRGERGCGGALIAPDIVLGAAHCGGKAPPSGWLIQGLSRKRNGT
jgi:hypothetical protein